MKVRVKFNLKEKMLVQENLLAKEMKVKPDIDFKMDGKDERAIREFVVAKLGKRKYGKMRMKGLV